MIKIRFKKNEYDFPYDADSMTINFAIDSTFDNMSVTSLPLGKTEGLDYSRRVPRGLLVTIDIEGEIFEFVTTETQMDQLSYEDSKYVHTLGLTSLAKETTLKTLENIKLTQPKGDLGIYTRSVNKTTSPLMIETGAVDLAFVNTINTNSTKIDGLGIISLEKYTVSTDVVIGYFPLDVTNQTMEINIKYNGVTIKQEEYKFVKKSFDILKWGDNFNKKFVRKTTTFEFLPTLSGVFSVEVIVNNTAVAGEFQTIIESASVSITSLEVLAKPIMTYAQLVDKILRNTNYVLSDNARNRLNLVAPEGKYEGYTLYDALNKIGGELGALIRVKNEINKRYWAGTNNTAYDVVGNSIYDYNPYNLDLGTILKIGYRYYINTESAIKLRYIDYEFFDNPIIFDVTGENETTSIASFEDYVSALELNTSNVIKPTRYSPSKYAWGSLRNTSGIGQMTTENICYDTEDNIEQITQVLVKGYPSVSTSNTWLATDVTDITSRVFQDMQYQTFPSEADYSLVGKQQFMKNNTLYFVQGQNRLLGMSYKGEKEDRFVLNNYYTRALYETILAVRSSESGELVTRTGNQNNDDVGLPDDLNIEIQVVYSNQTSSRTRVYKKDQSGFENEYVKYINESANVNDTLAIGNYTQELVNRMGGTKTIIEGTVDSLRDVAKVGYVDSLGRFYANVKISPNGDKIDYTYVLVQDYNIISEYIGTNSRHRVEEISNNSSANRTLRYTSKIFFTDKEEAFSTRLSKADYLFKHLLNDTTGGVNYGYLQCFLANGDEKRIHLSIDTDTKGQTIEIKWGLKDNYSAGLKRYSYIVGGETINMISDVPYTDSFGKVSDILFAVYEKSNNTYDKALYPEATETDGNNLFVSILDSVSKDAGEVLNALIEIPILSESSKVRVYNGFARFNSILGGTNRLQAVALKYIPQIRDNKIDLTRVEAITVNGSNALGRLDISTNLVSNSKGIAWYNIDTLDMVLAYIDDLPSSANDITLHYRIEDSIQGGGENVSVQISTQQNITAMFDLGFSNTVEFMATIGTSANYVGGIDYAVDSDVQSNVVVSFIQGNSTMYEAVSTIGIDIEVIQGLDLDNQTNVVNSVILSFELLAQAPETFISTIGNTVEVVLGKEEVVTVGVVGNVVASAVGISQSQMTFIATISQNITVDIPPQQNYIWQFTTDTNYTVTYSAFVTDAYDDSSILSTINNNYPVGQSDFNKVARVRVYDETFNLIRTVYLIVVKEN